jgi:hypothetical protein
VKQQRPARPSLAASDLTEHHLAIWRYVVALKRPEVHSPLADAFLEDLQETTAARFGGMDENGYHSQTAVLCDPTAEPAREPLTAADILG